MAPRSHSAAMDGTRHMDTRPELKLMASHDGPVSLWASLTQDIVLQLFEFKAVDSGPRTESPIPLACAQATWLTGQFFPLSVEVVL